jgi:hypothetical protein
VVRKRIKGSVRFSRSPKDVLGIFSEIFQSPSHDTSGGAGETQPLSSSCAEFIIFSRFSNHHPALMQSLEGEVALTRRTALVTEMGWKGVYKVVIILLHAL